MSGEIEYEITPSKELSLNLKELWEYKELFYFFTWRDIKVKYKQTIMGFSWAVLQPLMMTIIFTYFFGGKLGVPSDGIAYPVFVFSGLLLWNFFSTGLSNASNSMVNNANIIKKIYFPRLVIPISSIMVAMFDLIMSLIIYIPILIYYGYSKSILMSLLLLPFSLIIAAVTTFGLGSLLAALNVKYRDFRYVIPFFVQLLLFITPVIYPLSIINNGWLKYLFAINPMVGAIYLFRAALSGTYPEPQIIAISAVSSLAFFALGLFYFRKTEAYFADLA